MMMSQKNFYRDWPKETYQKSSGDQPTSFCRPRVSASARLVTNAPVHFTGFQVADAQLRQVARIALINLLHGKIRVIHLVLPCRHVFRIVGRGSNHWTSLSHAHAEFPRGGLINRVAEAMRQACEFQPTTKQSNPRNPPPPARTHTPHPLTQ